MNELFQRFPIRKNCKFPPLIKGWQNKATNNETTINAWKAHFGSDVNWGIRTGQLADKRFFIVVDIDNKTDEKLGDNSVKDLVLPQTFKVHTPTGGYHLYYVTPKLYKGRIGWRESVDIKGKNGYVLAPGAITVAGKYEIIDDSDFADCPDHIIEELVEYKKKARIVTETHTVEEDERSDDEILIIEKAVIEYLSHANAAIEGRGGNDQTYRIATTVKDYGVEQNRAFRLIKDHWNSRCSPPWGDEDLLRIIRNAYKYGQDPVGVKYKTSFTAEDIVRKKPNFHKELSPKEVVDEFNKNHAFVLAGSTQEIICEDVNHEGQPTRRAMSMSSFQNYYSAVMADTGAKQIPGTKVWLSSPARRTYKGSFFDPEAPIEKNGYYNLWTGFTCAPYEDLSEAEDQDIEAVELLFEHMRDNVTGGDVTAYHWLMSFFAITAQRPALKIPIAVVFKGSKGAGKGFFVERLGALFGSHYVKQASDRVFGNFNAHLREAKLLQLDEAFWGGSKNLDGVLKDLISSDKMTVERKGFDIEIWPNYIHLVMTANEDWVVPATHDERRYAIFNVLNGRRGDHAFWTFIAERFEKGAANRVLLTRLLNYECLPLAELRSIPLTEGLLDQKLETMSDFETFLFEAVKNDGVIEGEFGTELNLNEFEFGAFYAALLLYYRERGKSRYKPTKIWVSKKLREIFPNAVQTRAGQGRKSTYIIENIQQEFENYMGQSINWEQL